MQFTPPIFELLVRLWRHINSRRQTQFKLLLLLMILASFAEILSIGVVLPFLGVLTAPERIFEHPALQPIIQVLGFDAPDQLLLPITITFVIAILISNTMRLILLWASVRLSHLTGSDLGNDIYHRTLYQAYKVHVARNSSEVISGIYDKAHNIIYVVIMPTLVLISSSVMLIVILAALLIINPIIAIVSFVGFGLIYMSIIRFTRKQLLMDSQRIARESTMVLKSLQEGLGGIRDVLIDDSQAAYCQIYRNADRPLRKSQGNVAIIGTAPRYVLEALGILLIAILAYTLAQQEDGIVKAIPVLGALTLGAQRLLPVLQQGYAAWSSIQGGQASLLDTLALLDQPLPDYADKPIEKRLLFKKDIKLEELSYGYNMQTPLVLKNINLTINKGSRTGFIGVTGSGKTTLIDIIMGLLSPTNGSLKIDGLSITAGNNRAWQAHIAHVPQDIYLADSTIEENIAFGIPKNQIDHERVKVAANKAQIAEIIETWSDQYQTMVGERGVRLSGGQRQRIGIARALYKKADVIIFDEATSALDNETEQAVMQAIEGLSSDITILIIAHRLTTLKNCTQIVELSNGQVKRIGVYEDIVNQSI